LTATTCMQGLALTRTTCSRNLKRILKLPDQLLINGFSADKDGQGEHKSDTR